MPGTGKLEPPFVLLPALGQFSAHQQRLRPYEMRPGQARIDCQRARRTVERGIQFQTMVVNDSLVVQAHRIARCQCRGALRGCQRFIQPAQRAIYLADVSQIERRIDAVLQ